MNRKAATALAVSAGGAILLTIALLFGLSRREITVETVLPSVGGVEKGAPVLLDGMDVGTVTDIRLEPEGAILEMRVRGVQMREGSEVVLRPAKLRRPAVIEIRLGTGKGVGRFTRLEGRVSMDPPDGLLDPPFLLDEAPPR